VSSPHSPLFLFLLSSPFLPSYIGDTLGIKAEWDFLTAQYPTILEEPLIKLNAEEDAEAVSRFVPKHMVEAVAKSRLPLMVSDPVHRFFTHTHTHTRNTLILDEPLIKLSTGGHIRGIPFRP
jgi:hypothetical protein